MFDMKRYLNRSFHLRERERIFGCLFQGKVLFLHSFPPKKKEKR